MTPPEHLTSLSRDELLALVAALQRQVAELTAANEALRTEIAGSPGMRNGKLHLFPKARVSPSQNVRDGSPALAPSTIVGPPARAAHRATRGRSGDAGGLSRLWRDGWKQNASTSSRPRISLPFPVHK